jgi:WD40 repeat protein
LSFTDIAPGILDAEHSPVGNIITIVTTDMNVYNLDYSEIIQQKSIIYNDSKKGKSALTAMRPVPGNKRTGILYNFDGSRLFLYYGVNFIDVIDTNTRSSMGRLIKQGHSLTSANLSPDGKFLLTTSTDNIVRIWDISNLEKGNAFEVACQRLGNNTDLSDVIAKYGLGKLTPICGENMPILPDMSTLQ